MLDRVDSNIGIEHICFSLPEDVIDSREVIIRHGFDEDFVLKKLGISERRVLGENQAVSDIGADAVDRLLKESGTDASDIQLLIVVTQTGDYSLPHTSAIIQAKTGVSESAFVFDISLGCSGYVAALDVAVATMERLSLRLGVVVTADAYSRIVDPADRSTAPLFGDAATATLLSQNPSWILGRPDFGTQGNLHEHLILRGSGTKNETPADLFMDGRGILRFTRKTVKASVTSVLNKNSLVMSDIDYFVFHQANSFVLDSLTDDLGISPQKVVREHSDVGNTTSSSIPIALRKSRIMSLPTKVILVSGFGVGLSWHSNVLYTAEKKE